MRPTMATQRPLREVPADRYVCRRCGIERVKQAGRASTGLCRDCRDVERVAS